MSAPGDGDIEVDLLDLDVIQQFSLALRTASVSARTLREVLRSDLAWLDEQLAAASGPPPRAARGRPPA